MIEMPESVALEAKKIVGSMPARTLWKHEVEDAIVLAILAEREACAKIAEARHSYPVLKLEWDEEGGRHETPAGRGGPGAEIAAAIRRP